MTELKPIETRYKGYRFRSRLEARWGVFFDALGVQWEYEPEGYDLGDAGWYLPDFLVNAGTGEDAFVEIKPYGHPVNENEYNKASSISCSKDCAVVCGDPYKFDSIVFGRIKRIQGTQNSMVVCPRCNSFHIHESMFSYGAYLNNEYVYMGCQKCDFETPSGGDNLLDEQDRFTSYKGKILAHKGSLRARRIDYVYWLNRILDDAARRARSARFEHGENT